ncbi:MAG: DoxX family membrane protein [Planctomycetota bacterium]|nr:DoxX family membrane protein [Planctomycetota bacterium]
MGVRIWMAVNLAPLMLRLALGVVFVWAGFSKLAYRDPYVGERAAILAHLGVIAPPAGPGAVPIIPGEPAGPPQPEDAPATPAAPPGDPVPEAPPADAAPTEPAERPASPADADPPAERVSSRGGPTGGVLLLAAAAAPVSAPTAEAPDPARVNPVVPFTAADFPEPVRELRLYGIAIMLHNAAHPADPATQLWPSALATPAAAKALAWSAALVELLGGVFVLFGFLTRLAALNLAGTMFVAMLLTTVGPAIMSGDGFLGFLPDPKLSDGSAWVAAWSTLLFQFTLLMASLAVVFSGAGAFSLDRVFFGNAERRKPAKSSQG